MNLVDLEAFRAAGNVRFRVSPPSSKKNSRRLFIDPRTGRQRNLPSRRAERSEGEVADAWIEATRSLRTRWTEEEITMDVVYRVEQQIVDVTVGPSPTQIVVGRERDLHGMIETICDGLIGLAYKDDDQVGTVVVTRVP